MDEKAEVRKGYSKVPSLRNCVIRILGLILLNKIPLCKKLFRLIHAQFLLQWYIVILWRLVADVCNMSQCSRNANENLEPKLL